MSRISRFSMKKILHAYFPLILLFCAILNEIDFNNLGLKYFSFNFSYILIFYYSLKKRESLGYIFIFIAGLFNDVVLGLPMGISSLLYLLLCGLASYLRNITLRPNLIKDWIFFLISILIINSLYFFMLIFIYDFDVKYLDQLVNIIFTFLLYVFFAYLFDLIEIFFTGYPYDR